MTVVGDWSPNSFISLSVHFQTESKHSSFYWLGDSDLAWDSFHWPPQTEAIPWNVASKAPLVQSKEAQEFGEAFGLGNHPRALSDVVRERALRPTEFDPLSWGPANTLIELSELDQVQLVADLPDCEGGGGWNSGPDNSASNVARVVGWDTALTVRKDAGWVTIRPRYPSIAVKRIDRKKLQTLLRKLESNDATSFDALCDLARGWGPSHTSPLEVSYLQALFPTLDSGWSNLTCLYGKLTQRDRELLLSAHGTTLSKLSPGARRATQTAYLGGFIEDDAFTERVNFSPEEAVSGQSLRGKEPFDEFPNGLPPDSRLQLFDRSGPGIRVGEDLLSDVYTIPDFAGDDALFGEQGTLSTKLVAPGFVHRLILRVRPKKGSYIDGVIQAFIPGSRDFAPYSKLPANYRREIEDERKKQKARKGDPRP